MVRLVSIRVVHSETVQPQQYQSRKHEVELAIVADDLESLDHAQIGQLSQQAMDQVRDFVGAPRKQIAVLDETFTYAGGASGSVSGPPIDVQRKPRGKRSPAETRPGEAPPTGNADNLPLPEAAPAKETPLSTAPTADPLQLADVNPAPAAVTGLPELPAQAVEPAVTYTVADVTKQLTLTGKALRDAGETNPNGLISAILTELNPDKSKAAYAEVVGAILGSGRGGELITRIKNLAA